MNRLKQPKLLEKISEENNLIPLNSTVDAFRMPHGILQNYDTEEVGITHNTQQQQMKY